MTVNTAMALLGALKVAVGETTADHGDLRHPVTEKCLQDILRVSRFGIASDISTNHRTDVAC